MTHPEYYVRLNKIMMRLILFSLVVLSACQSVYQSEGTLAIGIKEYAYKYVCIHPLSADAARKAMENNLKEKGYAVFQASAFNQVKEAPSDIEILTLLCIDAGIVPQGLGS